MAKSRKRKLESGSKELAFEAFLDFVARMIARRWIELNRANAVENKARAVKSARRY